MTVQERKTSVEMMKINTELLYDFLFKKYNTLGKDYRFNTKQLQRVFPSIAVGRVRQCLIILAKKGLVIRYGNRAWFTTFSKKPETIVENLTLYQRLKRILKSI